MVNVGEIKEKFLEIVKKIFFRFPITLASIFLFIMSFAICIDEPIMDKEIFKNYIYFLCIFGVGTFAIESYLFKKKSINIGLYIISGIFSVISVILINTKLSVEHEFLFNRCLGCYFISLIIIGIFVLYKKSGKSFEEYVIKVLVNFVKTSFVYGIITIGISIVSSIFVHLLFGKFTLVLRLELLALGFYYIPSLLYSLIDIDKEVNSFFENTIKYVLGSLVLIAFAIIYIYMIKIFVTWQIPSNQIFRILAILFVLSLPIWTMIQYYKNNDNVFQKIFNKLPILFIPFIFLQIYSIYKRISENGITPIRYIGIMFILFEIIYVLMYLFKKPKIGNMLIVFDVLVIVSVLIPKTNMYYLSNISQAKRLSIYSQEKDFSIEEKKQIFGAYSFLKHSNGGEKYISLSDEDVKKIENFSDTYYFNEEYFDNGYYENDEVYISSKYDSINKINVKGYETMYQFSCYNHAYPYQKDPSGAFKECQLYCDGNTRCVDLTSVMQDYMNKYFEKSEEEFLDYFKANNEIIINENEKLIIKNFYIDYNKAKNEVSYYSLDGYLLTK